MVKILALVLAMAASTAHAVNKIPLKPDSANAAPCTVFGASSAGLSCGKTTAPSGIADFVGNVNVTGTLTTGGTVTGSNPLVVSSATIGTGTTISTFTSTGNATIAGTLTVNGASTLAALTTSGAASNTAGSVSVSSSTTSGNRFKIRGATTGSAPGTAVEGDFFYDATGHTMVFYNGTNWLKAVTATATAWTIY